MGFRAGRGHDYGGSIGIRCLRIEAEPKLVRLAQELAQRYDARPKFATGSFIPVEFEEDLSSGEEFGRTLTTAESAYAELDMELRDFDLVYAFPWPDEHAIYRSIMRQHGAPNAIYMRYDAREGLSVTRVHRQR